MESDRFARTVPSMGRVHPVFVVAQLAVIMAASAEWAITGHRLGLLDRDYEQYAEVDFLIFLHFAANHFGDLRNN